ncbi:hypothetical protein Mmc1_2711 [Magnetococcus marinus MC-1]|uniref:Uncharacterized protein n=1 Tax=Magnetococcus marinus (strain ATCC BAA-1437 / JCM 17883 / MC-1) TaxID=156889 RepID=A0L7C9_MAGMM|nr:hypothetical protein [Magnetococcus marinus]ABK43872.1 hypothetical protein Mmc1_1361 [Magnetococcus marinus MC-1]ABK45204.1 hypothetical protein Mmc1_2711 [Magnetococcus marinus MC-1]
MDRNKPLKIILSSIALILFMGGPWINEAFPFWGNLLKGSQVASETVRLGYVKGALSEDQIIHLTEMIQKAGDIASVRRNVGRMNLPQKAVLDTFIRIAVRQGKIPRKEAETLLRNLGDVPGFRSTLAKTLGVSAAKTKGHLNEIRIASAAVDNGFNVVRIGGRFDDGIKGGATDIDILLSRGDKLIPIEAKAYDDIVFSSLATIRGDMNSLVAFRGSSDFPGAIHPIFSFTNRPSNSNVLRAIDKETKKRGIHVIYGSAQEQTMQLQHLMDIL